MENGWKLEGASLNATETFFQRRAQEMNSAIMMAGSDGARLAGKLRSELLNEEVGWLSKTGQSLPLLGPGFLLLSCLKENPKGTVFRALDCRDLSAVTVCVVKEATATHGIDECGRDARDQLMHEAAILQAIEGRVAAPRFYTQFAFNRHSYLVTEYVPGGSFDGGVRSMWLDRPLNQRLSCLLSLERFIDQVIALHAAGYVHRDLALQNVRVTQSGAAYLLDFELAWAIGDDGRPFYGGTPGFLSPQQRCKVAPAISDDIYTVGANILTLLTQCNPKDMLFATHQDEHLWQLCATQGLTEDLIQAIIRCVHPRPQVRPSLQAVQNEIRAFRDYLTTTGSGEKQRQRWLGVSRPTVDVANLVRRGLEGLFSATPFDRNSGLWLSPVSGMAGPLKAYQTSRNAYKGIAGILYVLCTAYQLGFDHPELIERVSGGLSWLINNAPSNSSGLFFGEPGVAVAVSLAVRAKIIQRDPALMNFVHQSLNRNSEAYSIADGTAGIGIASLLCSRYLQEPTLEFRTAECVRRLLSAQNADGSWNSPVLPGRNSVDADFGFGRGVSGIVYFMAEYARHTGDAEVLSRCEAGAEWLLRRASYSLAHARVYWRNGSRAEEPICWWFRGSSGIALTFMSLYKCTGDSRYARFAGEALLCQPSNLAAAPMGQEYGLSGLGEIYLDAARILQQDGWHGRATVIAESIHHRSHPGPNQGLVWLVSDRFTANPALMTGSAGIVHFFLKLISGVDVPLPFLL